MPFATPEDFTKHFVEEGLEPPYTDARGIHPNNFGWIQAKLNDKWIRYLWERVDESHVLWKDKLAGHVDSSKRLDDVDNQFFNKVLLPLVGSYEKNFGSQLGINAMSVSQVKAGYNMQNWWVNHQKAGDFQPTHNHSGIYSFVIWMKVPFTYEEQNSISIAKEANCRRVSAFEFNYNDILGNARDYTYELGPSAEGVIVLFPAKLNHLVYPFYNCDEERVSISGNIGLDYTKGVPPMPPGFNNDDKTMIAHGWNDYFQEPLGEFEKNGSTEFKSYDDWESLK